MMLKHINLSNREILSKSAANDILMGGLVIVKADTSYAILSLPNHPKAKKSLAQIKTGRGNKQYSLFYHNKSAALSRISREHLNIINNILPGEVTIVVGKNEPAVRYIEKPTLTKILEIVRHPVTATSANPSNLPAAINLQMIKKYFSQTDILVLYESAMNKIAPSSIIDISRKKIKILRQGRLKIEKYLD